MSQQENDRNVLAKEKTGLELFIGVARLPRGGASLYALYNVESFCNLQRI